MSVTLTTSQKAAADNPAHQFKVLVDLETSSGLCRLATEPCSWSALSYVAQVMDPPAIVGEIGESPTTLPAVKTVAVRVANADGFWSRQSIDFYRQQIVSLSEVFLDVGSDAIRKTSFTITAGAMQEPESFQFRGEDLFAKYRRQVFPSNNVILTRSLYPQIADGSALGRPIPFAFGRSFVPMAYVDNTSYDVYVACVGCATVASGGYVAELFDNDGKGQPTLAPVITLSPAAGQTPLTGAFSLSYPLRSGIPVTEVVLAPGIPINANRWIDLVGPGGAQSVTPDQVLTSMLTNSWAGVCFDPTYIDSDALLAANSFYAANSIFFDGSITEQQLLETWLGAWQHDAMTRFLQRDKIAFVLPQSKSGQYSFSASNITERSLTSDDVDVGTEEDRRLVHYKDRTKDWTFGYTDKAGDLIQSVQEYDIGSGQNVEIFSPFIGRPSLAKRAAQFWACDAYYGRRRYALGTTVKAAAIEEGDPVTLTHSWINAVNSPMMVTGITRTNGRYAVRLKEHNVLVYSLGNIQGDPDFRTVYERIAYQPYLTADPSGGITTSFLLVPQFVTPSEIDFVQLVNHRLSGTPLRVRPWASRGLTITEQFYATYGGFATNNSQAIVKTSIFNTGSMDLANAWVIGFIGFHGFDLFLFD